MESCGRYGRSWMILILQYFSFHTHAQAQMQQTKTAIKLGLTPSTSKTRVIKIHSKTSNPILMNSTALKEIEAFMYRGGFADTTGGTDADTRSRINKARMAFNVVRKIWSSKKIPSQHSKYASLTPARSRCC